MILKPVTLLITILFSICPGGDALNDKMRISAGCIELRKIGGHELIDWWDGEKTLNLCSERHGPWYSDVILSVDSSAGQPSLLHYDINKISLSGQAIRIVIKREPIVIDGKVTFEHIPYESEMLITPVSGNLVQISIKEGTYILRRRP